MGCKRLTVYVHECIQYRASFFHAAAYLLLVGGIRCKSCKGNQRWRTRHQPATLTRQCLHWLRDRKPRQSIGLLRLFSEAKVAKLDPLRSTEALEPTRFRRPRRMHGWPVDIGFCVRLAPHIVRMEKVISRRMNRAAVVLVAGRGILVLIHAGDSDVGEWSKLFKLVVVGRVDFVSRFSLWGPTVRRGSQY